MELWTAQEIDFYDDLMANGIAYCTKVSEITIDNGYAYEWMAEQMKKRIGFIIPSFVCMKFSRIFLMRKKM